MISNPTHHTMGFCHYLLGPAKKKSKPVDGEG